MLRNEVAVLRRQVRGIESFVAGETPCPSPGGLYAQDRPSCQTVMSSARTEVILVSQRDHRSGGSRRSDPISVASVDMNSPDPYYNLLVGTFKPG